MNKEICESDLYKEISNCTLPTEKEFIVLEEKGKQLVIESELKYKSVRMPSCSLVLDKNC